MHGQKKLLFLLNWLWRKENQFHLWSCPYVFFFPSGLRCFWKSKVINQRMNMCPQHSLVNTLGPNTNICFKQVVPNIISGSAHQQCWWWEERGWFCLHACHLHTWSIAHSRAWLPLAQLGSHGLETSALKELVIVCWLLLESSHLNIGRKSITLQILVPKCLSHRHNWEINLYTSLHLSS